MEIGQASPSRLKSVALTLVREHRAPLGTRGVGCIHCACACSRRRRGDRIGHTITQHHRRERTLVEAPRGRVQKGVRRERRPSRYSGHHSCRCGGRPRLPDVSDLVGPWRSARIRPAVEPTLPQRKRVDRSRLRRASGRVNGINQFLVETALPCNSSRKRSLAHFKKGLGCLLQATEMKGKIKHGRTPPKNRTVAEVLHCSNADAAREDRGGSSGICSLVERGAAAGRYFRCPSNCRF